MFQCRLGKFNKGSLKIFNLLLIFRSLSRGVDVLCLLDLTLSSLYLYLHYPQSVLLVADCYHFDYFIIVFSTFLINCVCQFLGLGSRLDLYIHDYLMKRQLHATARTFQAEGNVSTNPIGKIII